MVLRKQVRTFVKGAATRVNQNKAAVKLAAKIGNAVAVGPAKHHPSRPGSAAPVAKK